MKFETNIKYDSIKSHFQIRVDRNFADFTYPAANSQKAREMNPNEINLE
jgi:hypothetical protein